MKREPINTQPGPDGKLLDSAVDGVYRRRKARDAKLAVAQGSAVSDAGPYVPNPDEFVDMHDTDPTDPAS